MDVSSTVVNASAKAKYSRGRESTTITNASSHSSASTSASRSDVSGHFQQGLMAENKTPVSTRSRQIRKPKQCED